MLRRSLLLWYFVPGAASVLAQQAALHSHSESLIESVTAATANPKLVCELQDIFASPGSTIGVDILLMDAEGVSIRGYETRLGLSVLSGTEETHVSCPCPCPPASHADGGVRIETTRPDYLFLNVPNTFTVVNCLSLAASSARLSGGTTPTTTSKYVADYSLEIPTDAAIGSQYGIELLATSALSDPLGNPIPFDIGPPCVVTVAALPSNPQAWVEVVTTAAATPADFAVSLPPSQTEYMIGKPVFAEIWVQTDDPHGLQSVSVDFVFDPSIMSVQSLAHTAAFSQFVGGAINNQAGLINDLTGSHPPVVPACSDQVGASPNWVRMAIVELLANDGGISSLSVFPADSFLFGTTVCGQLGDLPNSAIHLGTADVTIEGQPPSIVALEGQESTRALKFAVPASANAGTGSVAIRVELLSLQHPVPPNAPCCPPRDFSAFESTTCSAPGETEDCARWIGPPLLVRESQGNVAIGLFAGARLQCTPHYAVWSNFGTVAVFGAEVMPSSVYELIGFGSSCKGSESNCSNTSAPIAISTRRSGDVVAPFNPPAVSAQPDALDVVSLVNKFRNVLGAPSKTDSQLQPNIPELNADVNALDIVTLIDAFRGLAYPFSGPCACPSTVVCNGTPCTSAGQCSGGMCVSTCSGGSNSGLPCITDAHCPGGSCGAGFCRDRCGRCTP